MVEPPYLVPDAENTGYTEVLLDICVKEATKIAVPQTTRQVEVLSRAKSSFAALGNSVMVSDEHPIEVANDNCRLLDFCKSLDIPMPAYRMGRSREELVEAARHTGHPPPRSSLQGLPLVIALAHSSQLEGRKPRFHAPRYR